MVGWRGEAPPRVWGGAPTKKNKMSRLPPRPFLRIDALAAREGGCACHLASNNSSELGAGPSQTPKFLPPNPHSLATAPPIIREHQTKAFPIAAADVRAAKRAREGHPPRGVHEHPISCDVSPRFCCTSFCSQARERGGRGGRCKEGGLRPGRENQDGAGKQFTCLPRSPSLPESQSPSLI